MRPYWVCRRFCRFCQGKPLGSPYYLELEEICSRLPSEEG